MYKNVKYMGKTLMWWRDEVFHNTYTLGELYGMIKNSINLCMLAHV